jgi:type I restriction enzyme R subunit
MKGRGVRVIKPDDLKAVTPDASAKTRFVIVDCVGVSEEEMADTQPLERQPTVSLEKLLQAVAMGSTDPDIASTIASRLARLDRQLGKEERASLAASANGATLQQLSRAIVEALDPDRRLERARAEVPLATEPTEAQVADAAATLVAEALAPLATNPQLRQRLVDLKRSLEQVIDEVSRDELLDAGLSPEAKARALSLTTSFEQFLAAHRDEYAALELLYGSRDGQRLTRASVEELARVLSESKPPLAPEAVWRAYETLDKTRVRGRPTKLLTDVVSLVRFALHRDDALAPWSEVAGRRFDDWVARSETSGRRFTPEQMTWLEAIRDHVTANLEIDVDDFDYPPFAQRGGLGAAHRVFGHELMTVLEEVARVVAA